MNYIYIFDLPWIALEEIINNLSFIDRISLSISYPPIKQLVREKSFDFSIYLYKKLLDKFGKDLTDILFSKLNENTFIIGTFLFECLFDLELKSEIYLISYEKDFKFVLKNCKMNEDFVDNYRITKRCLFKCPKKRILEKPERFAENPYIIRSVSWSVYPFKESKINCIVANDKVMFRVRKFGCFNQKIKISFFPFLENISTVGLITFNGKKLSIRNLDTLIYKKYTLLNDIIIKVISEIHLNELEDIKKKIFDDFKKLKELGFVWDKSSLEEYKTKMETYLYLRGIDVIEPFKFKIVKKIDSDQFDKGINIGIESLEHKRDLK